MSARATSITAFGVVATVTLVALIAQMALLGALRVNSVDNALTLTPAVNAQLMGSNAAAPIKFDVSRGAASELGFADAGTARVTLQVIDPSDIAYLHSNIRKYHPLTDVLKTPAIALQTVAVNN